MAARVCSSSWAAGVLDSRGVCADGYVEAVRVGGPLEANGVGALYITA